jgi:hypothetical protein
MAWLDWYFGPDISVDARAGRVLVPLTTSIDNLNSVREYVRRELGVVEVITDDAMSMRINRLGDADLKDVYNDIDDTDRFKIHILGGTPEDVTEGHISDAKFIMRLPAQGPTSFGGPREDMFPAVAGILQRDARRRLATARLIVAAKAATMLALAVLVVLGWLVAPIKYWPETSLLSIAAVVSAVWITELYDRPGQTGSAQLYGLRRDRTVVLHRGRRQIIEDRLSFRRQFWLSVGGVAVGAILGVTGTYLSYH